MDVIHVAKWIASRSPAMRAAGVWRRWIVRRLRLANGTSTAAPAKQRQKEIASGSAVSAYLTRMAEQRGCDGPDDQDRPRHPSGIRLVGACGGALFDLHAG